MRLLDLFCGAGGCAVGYHRAGFTEIVGVDIEPQKNYPFIFRESDALDVLRCLVSGATWMGYSLSDFDAVHASPPCQAFSDLKHFTTKDHPKLIDPTRDLLNQTGKPWVIENVEGAPLVNPILLCGTMFPGLRVIRHRLFESNVHLMTPPHTTKHPLVKTTRKSRPHFGKIDEKTGFVSVTGGGNCGADAARDAMGIDWMNKQELNQAIPPAYTEYIGKQLIAAIR
jgi:DNA (cytosine-5)-methyltransferase 1